LDYRGIKLMINSNILKELSPLFKPRAVALIGASGKPGKIGRLYMDRFIESGFANLFPINLKEKEILGIKAFPNVKEVPGDVDLAIILLPPEAVMQAVKDCVSKGVKGIVINSAGFGEGGNEGKAKEQELVRIAREGGARIIGPNCLGIYCPASKLPFPQGPSMDIGKVGIISQSGSLADHFALVATSQGIKFSKVISVGNQSDLKVNDFLEYLGADPDTEIILSYLEGVVEGKRFHELTREISEKKPIIVWKCGTSEAGARAAATHTGALAGSPLVWEGVLRGNGVIRAGSFEEILDCVTVFHHCNLLRGNRVAIITGPGGPAVGTTDACIGVGLEVPDLSEETKTVLNEVLPSVGTSAENPIDMSITSAAVPEIYKDVIKILDQDDKIDMMLAIGSGGGPFYQSIIEAVQEVEKPVVGCVMMPLEVILEGYEKLGKHGIPFFPDPVRAAKALAKLAAYSNFRRSL
jgi:acetyl-CoA synthetase (ADP-forming)